MTPTTTQALTFDAEGNAGNTDQNFRKLFAVESFGRFRRLEDSVSAAAKLGTIANPARDDRADAGIDARKKDGAVRRERVGQEKFRRNFVADRGVEDDRRGVAIELARKDAALDEFRPSRCALASERIAARDHDRSKILLFVRHSRRHGGSGVNCSIARLLCRRARLSL